MGSLNAPRNHTSRFSSLEPTALDGPFALEAAFRKDTHEAKVNLGIGAYRDDEGRPWPLSAVKEAKKRLAAGDWSHEYLPLHGDDSLLQASRTVLFGSKLVSEIDVGVASVQTVSGTGANSLIARFAGKHLNPAQVLFPDPTWDNHFRIWRENSPHIVQRWYPYYDLEGRVFDFDGIMATLRQDAVAGDVILLHACAHNPTDPSQAQWAEIASLCEEKQLFVIFDVAYQGLHPATWTEMRGRSSISFLALALSLPPVNPSPKILGFTVSEPASSTSWFLKGQI
ncbi:Aspartate aminotransferase [Tolypocladium paradoxum]|uniref:Aspartate aminotransferase n=1 Tax=Tolypocladium paradoxum TaxID=94208 RepID=A0A2S4KSA3_9HYPO|nr:Aspartate aminotransferase [Tolypocladium paradoxum]